MLLTFDPRLNGVGERITESMGALGRGGRGDALIILP